MDKELKLKPCPFCGSNKAGVSSHSECYGHGWYMENIYIRCSECGARTKDINEYNGSSKKEVCINLAAEAWNRRV